jgi:hypothetical protein
MHRRIDAGAVSAGRDPGEVLRIYNVFGRITDGPSNGFLDGPVDRWVDELTDLAATHRMDAFVAAFEGPLETSLVSFAEKIVPAVRDALGEERSVSER